jgi:hypothetical protein
MNLQTKILEGVDGEDYWILVARGALTEGTLRETLQKIAETMRTQAGRKFLVDLQYTTIIRKGELNIDEVLTGLEKSSLNDCRVIFVCPMGSGHYRALHELSVRLAAQGVGTAVFTDPKRAADWLTLQRILKEPCGVLDR